MSFPTGDALTQQPSSKGKAEGKNAAATQTQKHQKQSNRNNLVVQGTTKGVEIIFKEKIEENSLDL